MKHQDSQSKRVVFRFFYYLIVFSAFLAAVSFLISKWYGVHAVSNNVSFEWNAIAWAVSVSALYTVFSSVLFLIIIYSIVQERVLLASFALILKLLSLAGAVYILSLLGLVEIIVAVVTYLATVSVGALMSARDPFRRFLPSRK